MLDIRALLQAAVYDYAMRKVEKLCLADWRAELLTPLRGEILEIGSGTGINLQYYSPECRSITLSEPDSHMRCKLNKRVSNGHLSQVKILASHAEQLDLPDASLDHIVSTLVLCSVTCIETTLAKLQVLLRPGGSLVLLEHVRADEEGLLRTQQRLEPAWKWCAGNCHLTRPTEQLLRQAGFDTKLQKVKMRGAPSFVRPMIKGVAFRT